MHSCMLYTCFLSNSAPRLCVGRHEREDHRESRIPSRPAVGVGTSLKQTLCGLIGYVCGSRRTPAQTHKYFSRLDPLLTKSSAESIYLGWALRSVPFEALSQKEKKEDETSTHNSRPWLSAALKKCRWDRKRDVHCT